MADHPQHPRRALPPLDRDAEPAPAPEEGAGPFPWDCEEDAPGADPAAPRQRHDAFTEAKKRQFLKALVKTGCTLDACRLTGAAPRTVYRHQESDPRFLAYCQTALRMSGALVELTAWERAVEGVEEEIAVGGRLVKRRRYSENLLRLLLQASDPKKYGRNPGFGRKRILRHEKKQMEREIRARIADEEEAVDPERTIDSIMAKLKVKAAVLDAEKLAKGWTRTADGEWVPPGYALIPGWVAPPPRPNRYAGRDDEEGPPRDSV